MRCPVLIGRAEPAALIAETVARLAGAGRGGALVMTGEAGIGKSRLAGHMSTVAAPAGTVEKHVAGLLAKLGAADRGSLARLARGLR